MGTNAELVDPYYEQEPFLWDKHRYYGFISGVGAGKTAAGVIRTAYNASLWNPGEMGAIISPSTRHIKDSIFPVMRRFGLRDKWEYSGPQAETPGFRTPEGGRVVILSTNDRTNVERLANLNLAYWWVDEARLVPGRAIEILEQRLRVGEYRNGYITSTPRGEDHLHDFFIKTRDKELDREWGKGTLYESAKRLCVAHVPSWANPHNPEDFDEEMRGKEDQGQVYEREILGKFVDYKGLIYSWFGDDHITTAEPEQNVREYVYGVDWGTRNPSVLLCLKRYDDGWLVADEFYSPVDTYSDFAQIARKKVNKHGPGTVYCDPSEPDGIEEFRRLGLNAQPAENDVQPGIKSVNETKDQLQVMDTCQNLQSEFSQYRYQEDSEEPIEGNDHALDALRYALHTHRSAGGQSLGIAGANRGV